METENKNGNKINSIVCAKKTHLTFFRQHFDF